MSEDLACLIMISVDEINRCHRYLDLEDLLRHKLLDAHYELMEALEPEVIKS